MAPPSTKTLTLQGLIDFVSSDERLSPSQRAERTSALRSFAKVCGKHPSEIIADPQVIRALIDRASWQLAGLSKQRWANVLSLVTSAMKIAGVKVRRRRKNRKLDETWEALLAPLARRDRDELHPFAGWCSALGIAPSEVGAVVFGRFLEHLEQETIQRNPRERAYVPRRAWNRTVASIPGSPYPVIPNAEPAGWRGQQWDAFPPSLLVEIEAYKAAAVKTNFFAQGKRRAIKPITARNYVNNLRWYLSVLVQDGVPAEQFTSLGACLDAVLVERGLNLRLGGRELDDRSTPGLSAMITALINIARYVEVPAKDAVELKRLADLVRHRPEGMCERNIERLSQFTPDALRALINLPFHVEHRLAKVTKPTVRQAQEYQIAALLAILLYLPVRIKNAAALDLNKHFKRPIGGSGEWQVHFEPREVKNGVAIDGRFNDEVSTLLARYVEVFRPVLLTTATSKLFVSQNGTEKGSHALGSQFSGFIKREIGLSVNPHLMRHLAAFAYLEANPGDFESVRQMLGHKDVATTVKFYSGANTRAALKRYDMVVSAYRDRQRTYGGGQNVLARAAEREREVML